MDVVVFCGLHPQNSTTYTLSTSEPEEPTA
jgi:hypothetical protein